MPATTATTQSTATPTSASARTHRALTVLAATVAGVLGWAVADPLLGVQLTVQAGDAAGTRDVGVVAVTAGGLFGGLAGWAVLAVLERFTARARTIWPALAVLSLVLSMGGPFEAVTTAATATLAVLHLLVGGTLLALLPRTARQ